jgi:hypothetical protein
MIALFTVSLAPFRGFGGDVPELVELMLSGTIVLFAVRVAKPRGSGTLMFVLVSFVHVMRRTTMLL